MLLYVTVGTNNLERALEFYDPVLGSVGLTRQLTNDEEAGYAENPEAYCSIWIVYPYDKQEASFGNGSMTAFRAKNREQVRAFHAAALLYGGSDEGAPGLRPYHASYYSAYVRDPDGNKLSAVCEQAE